MAYFSEHPTREVTERYEWALTRQLILKAPGHWKDVPVDKFVLTFGTKRQTQEEIDRNLALVRTALTAKDNHAA